MFQRNNPPTFKGRYDTKGDQTWLHEIEKIFKVIVCTYEQQVLFGTYMISEEAGYWLENTRQRMEAANTEIAWANFKIEFLEKYFPTDVCIKKEIEFL